MLASVQAPVIMMSQNRQDVKDRLRGELDYAVNRRAESEIQAMARKLNLLGEKLEDVEQLVRELKAPRGACGAIPAHAARRGRTSLSIRGRIRIRCCSPNRHGC